MYFRPKRTRHAAMNAATWDSSSMRRLKATRQRYLLMGRRVQARPTPWQARSKYSKGKCTGQMNGRAYFQEQFKSFGARYESRNRAMPLRRALHKFITNKSETYLTCLQECCTADGTQVMGSLWRTSSWWTVAISMIWYRCCSRACATERVVRIKWIKTQAEVTRYSHYILLVRSKLGLRVSRDTGKSAL